jgi:hypothetical protein
MKPPSRRTPLLALALAAVSGVVLSGAAPPAGARDQTSLVRELWSLHLDERAAAWLTAATLKQAKAAGVNAVVVQNSSSSAGALSRARRLAAASGLYVPRIRTPQGCRQANTPGPCVVRASSVQAALRLSRRNDVDLVVVRIAGPGALSALVGGARGHILAVSGLGGRSRFDARLWRSAVRAAHKSAAVDLGVLPGSRAGARALAAYEALLTEALRGERPPAPPAPPSQPPAPQRRGDKVPGPLAASTGQTFYVSPGGSDANAGNQPAPWRTIQRALDRLKPGQRALVRAGTYREDLEFSRAGTAAAPITVEAYPGERPVLTSAGGHPLEIAEDGAYLRFSGFVITRHPGTSGGNVDVYGHHIEISRNEILGSRDQGVYTAEESHHVQILGNWIHDNGEGISHQSHGIYLQGDAHLVANNRITDHPEGFGIQVYDSGRGSIITNNTVTGAGHSGIVIGGDGGVSDITVVNNVFAFNAHYGISHDSTCPTGSRAHHNLLFGNGWGGAQPGCPGLDYAGGNRNANPRFSDYRARDLHLLAASPAVDYGLAEFAPADDHEGHARPRGAAPDVGAYER